MANRNAEYADKNACGTCRTLTADGKPVEHEECAARAQMIEAPDAPTYEDLTELTLEQKAALPARFHVPVFDDLGRPKAWPCATASEKGAEVFTR